MQIPELTKQDLKNIKMKEKIDEEIYNEIKQMKDKLLKEKTKLYNVNYNDIEKSENIKYRLERIYFSYNCDNTYSFLLFGGVSIALIIACVANVFYKGLQLSGIPIYLIWSMSAILSIAYGVKLLNIRRKIKKNFKELGVESIWVR